MDITNHPTINTSPSKSKEKFAEKTTCSKTSYYKEINNNLMENNLAVRKRSAKEKSGFWPNLFGDKKCKYCSLKKSKCLCNKTKCSILSDTEFKSASTQPSLYRGNEQCKSLMPKALKRCGVHLHFCFEPAGMKKHLKSNSLLPCGNNMRIYNSNNEQKHHSKCIGSELICNQESIRALTNEPKGYLLSSAIETRINKPLPNEFSESLIHEKDKSFFSKINTENIVLHTKVSKSSGFKSHEIKGNKISDYGETPKEYSIKDNLNILQNGKESFQPNDLNKDQNYLEKDSGTTEHQEQELKTSENVARGRLSILRKPIYDIGHTENIVLPLIAPHTEDNFKDTFDESFQNYETDNLQQHAEKIIRESKEKKNAIHKTKKPSQPIKSTFVRNSLINIRREKLSNVLDEKISMILMKLSSIEDKILELEKDNGCETNDDITISCNSKKSTVSIEFGKQDKPNHKEKQSEEITTEKFTPPKESFSNTIKVKSKDENVYIKSNGNISVIKQYKRKPKIMSANKPVYIDTKNPRVMSTNQVVYCNPYELDAHSLASNSYLSKRTSIIKNPRVVIQCATKNLKPTFCDKWRRISEELKISDTHMVTE